MRYVIGCFIYLLILPLLLVAQEPIAPVINYEAEIGWGPLFTVFWTKVPISYTVASGSVMSIHKPVSKLGIQKWEVPACDSIARVPKKVMLSFYITALPDSGYDYYYLRVRGYVNGIGVSPWSDVGVSVKITGRP